MLYLNLHNVEELIFYDKNIQIHFPEFRSLFDQWRLAQMSPALRSLGKRSVIDFMNSLDDTDVEILQGYFDTKVTITKLEYNIVKNLKFPILSNFGTELDLAVGFTNITTYRDKNYVYISMWR